MADLPRPAIRRPISVTVLSLTFFAILGLTPIVLPVLALVDLVTRSRLRRSRIWLIGLAALGNEGIGTWLALAMIVFHAGRLDSERCQRRFHRLMRWWGGRHVTYLRHLAGVRWFVENPEEVVEANAIVLARHASHPDAILPLLLFGTVGGHRLRYILKDELQWSPAMDIVGNLLPNVFVDRSPGADSPLWARIRDLATGVGDDTVTVIFPEGTFYTPGQLDRAASRIAQTRPDLETAARSLWHLLPPRPAGTLALLEGAPDADVVLVAHEGMESFGDLATIRANLPLVDPVRVRLWRIDRADVPGDQDAFITWLLDRWIEMDHWIHTCVEARSAGLVPTANGAVGLQGREFRP